MTKEEFLDRARAVHGYKYDYSKTNYKNIKTSIIIILNNIEYIQSPDKHLMGRCPEKNNLRKTTQQFIEESKKVWGNKYDYSLVEYKGALKKVKILYEGIIFEQVAVSHISGMALELNLNQEYFLKKSKDLWGNKYDYSLVEFKRADVKVKIIYNNIIYEQIPTAHLQRSAPEKIQRRFTLEQFIDKANKVHDFKFTYEKVDYITNNIKVLIKCPLHDDYFEQTPASHLRGTGCPICNESKGEKEIVKFLKKYNINFDRQKKFSDCKNTYPLPFDFWIPSMGTLIEFDGIQHFKPIEVFGGNEAFNKVRVNDKIKNNYCEDNYLNLIRIKYDQIDEITKILWNNLKDLIKR